MLLVKCSLFVIDSGAGTELIFGGGGSSDLGSRVHLRKQNRKGVGDFDITTL